ncbi:class I SAM-dependent methyltransferase [Mycolicibacterium brisbanense]|uniref:Methyltransferase family protein n=1 Tax=Mycolicibacterium brisbanense TaxID=146020 RepID=A0A100W2T0_9MYCO|nr:class I SAM-dependent methyltransferase [Mycolicibacterium brisbanense]MCV7158414.1 class I SAM-dependent methyltransferase [Mycolicibacterium brisbanense]GAS90536.1 methyltransferase family protein [Mycolicibacterium brisbanense]
MSTPTIVDNPFFARVWKTLSSYEPDALRRLRAENLSGLTGRVLEVGAGTGTNFALYPDTVTEVVAIEPERHLAEVAQQAAAAASVPVAVTGETAEQFATAEPFDAVVCSLVLCSIDDPGSVLRQLYSVLRPGGQLRYLEHVASSGYKDRLQRIADATVWPRLLGNCHTHRDTERTIVEAGFVIDGARREWVLPTWVPLPVSEWAIGRAARPA